jgi:hypothetical protein
LGVNITSQNAINNVQRTNLDIELKIDDANCIKWTLQIEGLEIVCNLFRPRIKQGHILASHIGGCRQYAERMGNNGCMMLVIDHSHFSESEGDLRQHEDHAKKIEDF